MSKQLRELYGFDESNNSQTNQDESEIDNTEDDIDLTEPVVDESSTMTLEQAYANMEKIDQALPVVRGLDATDSELDHLAKIATDTFKDLTDLAYQVDSRAASEIFHAASSMLGHAITAKTAKINKKLKMLDLMLKKSQLDQKMLSLQKPSEESQDDTSTSLKFDRNDLIKQFIKSKNDK
jgi:phytoene dehydrogenase-like protein